MQNNSKISTTIPFMFEENIGQHDNESKFVLRNNKGTVFFLDSEIVFALMKTIEEEKQEQSIEDKLINVKDIKPKEYQVNLLKMKLENSNQTPEILGQGEFNCKINYFKGSDSSKWKTNIPIYEKIIYKEVYPRIDLTYYENQGILEHAFIIDPSGDINNIKMYFEGADKIELDKDGNVLIYAKDDAIKMAKPISYQEVSNKKIEIESNFVIEDNYIKFNVKNYDKSKVLVIDPTILYGTYLGGSADDYGRGVAVDNNENAYITGYTFSTDFPVKNAYQGELKGIRDAFLIKIDTKLSGVDSIIYGTYLGGSSSRDEVYGVAVDNNENAYITGSTFSTDFPLQNAYQETLKGTSNAFLIKIDTKLSKDDSLKYATYLGGNAIDVGSGVAVDNNENAYITGFTCSTDFPLKNAYQGNLKGDVDAFLIKIDTKLIGASSLIYGTYLGGGANDYGSGVAVDNNENAYIIGDTYSTDFPLQNAYQDTFGGTSNAFLIKIDTKLSKDDSLKYSTYLGGNGFNLGTGVAVDNNENAYITGNTSSTDFPVKNAYQDTLKGNQDAFLIKIDTKLSGDNSLIYGTYLGGNAINSGKGVVAVAVDNNENAYITGNTSSTDFPVKNAYQDTLKGNQDAFLIKIDTKLSGDNSLIYGTYLGGNGYESGYGVAVDNNENAYITGYTYSTDFPVKNAYQETFGGIGDAFLIKLDTKIYDIVLQKSTCECKVSIGDKIAYTIKVTNNGPDKVTNIVVTDKLANGLTIDSLYSTIGNITTLANIVTWNIEELEVGQSAIAMIVVKTNKKVLCSYKKTGEFISNTASLTCDNIVNPSSTTDTVVTYVDCTCKNANDCYSEDCCKSNPHKVKPPHKNRKNE